MRKSKRPKTHFEQVPLEVVRKLAMEDSEGQQANEVDVPIDSPAKNASRVPGMNANHTARPVKRRPGEGLTDKKRKPSSRASQEAFPAGAVIQRPVTGKAKS